MGGLTFEVHCEELEAVGQQLLSTADELDHFRDVRSDYGVVLGSRRVSGALDDFFEHWSDGIYQMAKTTRQLGNLLKKAAEDYRLTDDEIRRGMQQPLAPDAECAVP